MDKKSRNIRIRITEDQFKRLSDSIIQEEMTKSSLIREILQDYFEKNCRNSETMRKSEISRVFQDTTHSNPKRLKMTDKK
jgi:hypothetical protein